MPASEVKAPAGPPVIRASLIESEIWSLAVTLEPTWNTPPLLTVVEADAAATLAAIVVPSFFTDRLPVVALELRTNSTDHAPPPRSRTLTVTEPVNPAVAAVCALMSVWSSAWYDAAVAYVPAVRVTVTERLAPEPESMFRSKVGRGA